MVDPDKAPILAAVAAVVSEDAPAPEPTPKPARKPAEESVPKPVATTGFTSRVQSLVDNLAKENPDEFGYLKARVNSLLTGKGYIDTLLATATDDSVVAENVRLALGRLGITNSVLEDLPFKRFITVTATHRNVIERARGSTPKVIFYKKADSTINVYWKNVEVPKENKYKDITGRSADDVQMVAAVLAVNKQDVDMGPLGIMMKFMNDTNVPKELQSVMEDVLRKMGVDANVLYEMKDNTYITVKTGERDPSIPITSSDAGILLFARVTLHIIKSNETFQRVSRLPESLKSKKPLRVVTEETPTSTTPPVGSTVVPGKLIKLFDFLHKQSMTGGTARHNLPHRPAKKTRRNRRR